MMVQRCTNPNYDQFRDYGGRGIQVCERWRTSFEAFLEDMGERPAGTTLDRENGDGHYEPSNCRWATNRTQSRNKRSTRLWAYQGRTQCVSDWAKELGLAMHSLTQRVDRLGWSIERALSTPPMPRGNRLKNKQATQGVLLEMMKEMEP